MVQPLWRKVWRFLKKLKIKLPCDLAIPLLGIYPNKAAIKKDTSTPMLTAALFTTARTWKQTKCPSTDDWIKMWYIYTMEFYLAIKNNEIMPFAAISVDLEIIILSKSERESQIPQDITNIWNLKYDTGLPWWLSGEKSTCQCQRHEFEP